jgi:hypothetical protein
MKNSEVRILEMLIRVRQFGASHERSFPEGSRAAQLFALVSTSVANMETHAATQQTHARAAKETTTQKGAAFEALQEQMEAISRTARAMSPAVPGLRDKFRVPRSGGMQTWLAAARSFAEEAAPIKDEFTRRGMESDFLDTFRTAIEAVEAFVNARAQKSAAQVGATAAVADAADDGRAVVRELDAIVRNLFRNDPASRAEWDSARHVERATRRARRETPPVGAPHPEG